MKPIPPSRYVWFDGRFVPGDRATIPITTHAIHYGTSVFEGIRAHWDSKNLFVFRLDDHIRRFRRSGEFYEMSLNYTDQRIREAVVGLCRKNGLKTSAYIRPFYFIGEYGINLHVTKRAPTHLGIYTFPFGDLFDKGGIAAGVSSWRRFSDATAPPQAKMGGNYLNSILATQEAKRGGYDEALLLDQNGNISEAPGENVFIVRGGRLITPPISASALEGLTRDSVIRIARDSGIEVAERDIPRSEIHMADEVFLCGTAADITPVRSVDNRRIGNGRAGALTRRLMREYDDATMNKNERYADWITPVY